MVKHDYYDLLGVGRDADGETIRRAFYAAARDWHPEVSQSSEAEDRFRELSEAYSVLSNPSSRLLYDRYGFRGRTTSGRDELVLEEPEPLVPGDNVEQELAIRWFEAEEGTSRLIRFRAAETCPDCEGQGTAEEPDPACPVCGGTGRPPRRSDAAPGDVEHETCPVCSPDLCATCGGSGVVDAQRRLRVRVPAGLETGEQLRVAGEGNAGPYGGPAGDLLLNLTVLPEPSEPRYVRYVALALFLAAVAVLVFYLH